MVKMMKVNQKKQHQLKTDPKTLEKTINQSKRYDSISQQKERVQLNIFDFDSMDEFNGVFIHRRRKTYVSWS